MNDLGTEKPSIEKDNRFDGIESEIRAERFLRVAGYEVREYNNGEVTINDQLTTLGFADAVSAIFDWAKKNAQQR